MASEEPKPTNLPLEGVDLERRASHIAAEVHPRMVLDRKRGYEFAAELAEYIEPSSAKVGTERWLFTSAMEGSPNSRFEVSLSPTRIQIGVDFPTVTQEWVEARVREVLQRFEDFFQPKLLTGSAAMVRATLPIDGDAREFLAQHVMNIDMSRLNQFRRPVHMVGMKLLFPPYKTKDGKGGEDWLLKVTAESLLDDPSRVYLEADARWSVAGEWNDRTIDTLVQHSVNIYDYMKGSVLGFIAGPRTEKGERGS